MTKWEYYGCVWFYFKDSPTCLDPPRWEDYIENPDHSDFDWVKSTYEKLKLISERADECQHDGNYYSAGLVEAKECAACRKLFL